MAEIKSALFFDLHIHGVAGVDFMNASHEAMAYACTVLGREGIGYFAPTLLTAEPRLLEDACRNWGSFLAKVGANRRFLPADAAWPLGLHLEGPFLSPKMAGAHPLKWLKAPSVAVAKRLIDRAQGHIAIFTVAPELPGALALGRALARRGIRVQMGHSTATADQALAAVRAGFTGITHLYNAMRVHHRDPAILAALAQRRVTAEIITDGHHIDPKMVSWSVQAAGERIYGISDGCCAIGAPKGRTLTLGSLVLRREGEIAVVAKTGTLAGGATFLTRHPAKIWPALREILKPKAVLGLFHIQQKKLFEDVPAHGSRKNHFDAKTLRFLGCE